MGENEELARIIEEARPCFQCGICSSSCPVFRVAPEMNPRLSIDEIIQTGEVASIDRIWACAMCLTCEQRCPTGVSLAHLLVRIKNISTKQGGAPESLVEVVQSILSQGIITQASDLNKVRDKFELPHLELPNSDHIRTILEETGVIEVLEQYMDARGTSE